MKAILINRSRGNCHLTIELDEENAIYTDYVITGDHAYHQDL
jgi:hypothetical protein